MVAALIRSRLHLFTDGFYYPNICKRAYFSPDTVPRVGDRVTVFSDVIGGKCPGVVKSVTPQWETAETLRQRYEIE